MDPHESFARECRKEVELQAADPEFQRLTLSWREVANRLKYSYHFTALGRPIIQFPQDIVAVQELIWRVRPDCIIETGVAHGGSLILSASMLALLDWADAVEQGAMLDPGKSKRCVIGIDIDIREHNRSAIEEHPMSRMIQLIEGSSTSDEVVDQVIQIARKHRKIMIFLDSNHTHEHVLNELEAYAPLVSKGSNIVVFDTVIEDLRNTDWPGRDWGAGNNPKTAIKAYLQRLETEGRTAADGDQLRLATDKEIEHKIMVTVAPDGYLHRPC